MRKYFNKYTAIVVTVAGLMSGCGKDFLDINTNPNSPTSATPNLILSAGLNRTATQLSTSLNILGSLWVGQIASPTDYLWYVSEKQYNITSSFYTGIWDTGYDILNDFEATEVNAKAANMNYYIGMAKIMKAYNFQILVDTYGNVPYSEALKGTSLINPKYDNAQDVYNGIMSDIDAGIAAIKSASATETKPSTDDILFKGNMTLWIKFANTLKLRILIRQSEMTDRAAYITAEIAKITAEGSGFLGSGESAQINPGYVASSGKLNPFWESYYQTAAGAITNNYRGTKPTEYVLAKYDENTDPRKAQMYNTITGGGYRVVPLGEPTTGPNVDFYKTANTSGLKPAGAVLKTATGATPILISAESLFLQAEAVQRGWLTGSAATLYNSAIAESFSFSGVANAATEAVTYSALPGVNFALATNKIEAIIKQKWLALNIIGGWELWNDFRRTGFPSDNPLSKAALTAKHPARLMYPNSELGTNSAQVKAQGTIDPFDTKIFWDKN